MTQAEAEQFLRDNRAELDALFEEQINAPVGGLYNPTVKNVYGNEITFDCHYDGHWVEDDWWEWIYDVAEKAFYN